MKIMVAIAGFLFAGSAVAQGVVYELDVRQMLSRPWIELGSDQVKTLSYQIDHSIHYVPGVTPQNKTHDIILRVATRGPYGKVTHTGLVFFTLTCFPDGTMANQIGVKGMHEYPSDASGMPDAAADNSFYIQSPGSVESVDAGTPPAVIGKRVCAKR